MTVKDKENKRCPLKNALVFILAMLVLSSCAIPFPHYVYNTPKIAGVITRNSQPLQGATVVHMGRSFYINENACSTNYGQRVLTDERGAFVFEADKEFRWIWSYLYILGEPDYAIDVCIKDQGKSYPAYWESGFRTPKLIELVCNIDEDTKDDQYYISNGREEKSRICKNTKSKN